MWKEKRNLYVLWGMGPPGLPQNGVFLMLNASSTFEPGIPSTLLRERERFSGRQRDVIAARPRAQL